MNNPGVDQDATLYIPTGGRGGATPRGATFGSPQVGASFNVDFDSLSGINRLVKVANPILCSIAPLREMLVHPDPGGLRQSQLEQISLFEKKARELGISPESILVARYALCTFVDEAIAGTPWGGTAELARNSLLVTLHKEAAGGEKFFQLLNRMAEDPGHNIELLEFFYVCLALGFEGRFRVIEGGKTQLDALRERLADLIKRQRGEYERDLSKQWRGEVTNSSQFSSLLPFWVTLAATGVVLAIIFVCYLFLLSADSDKIAFASLNPPKPVQRVEAPKNIPPRLTGFLTDEISKGLVEVRDDANESLVTIRGDGLFDSGSADLKSEYEGIILRIADAINQVPGQITVIGHTDNIPLRSILYPSNWNLSQGRAATVASLIKTKLSGQRIVVSEGRGDAEPLVPNDTPANRALNRRVEILLKVAPK